MISGKFAIVQRPTAKGWNVHKDSDACLCRSFLNRCQASNDPAARELSRQHPSRGIRCEAKEATGGAETMERKKRKEC